jgi:hypothetical protein
VVTLLIFAVGVGVAVYITRMQRKKNENSGAGQQAVGRAQQPRDEAITGFGFETQMVLSAAHQSGVELARIVKRAPNSLYQSAGEPENMSVTTGARTPNALYQSAGTLETAMAGTVADLYENCTGQQYQHVHLKQGGVYDPYYTSDAPPTGEHAIVANSSTVQAGAHTGASENNHYDVGAPLGASPGVYEEVDYSSGSATNPTNVMYARGGDSGDVGNDVTTSRYNRLFADFDADPSATTNAFC